MDEMPLVNLPYGAVTGQPAWYKHVPHKPSAALHPFTGRCM